jgi:hypothetical protein
VYEYAKWYDISKEVKTELNGVYEKIYVSVINEKNTVTKKWIFNGLIARLYAGAWDLNNIKQDFKKKTDKNSILGNFEKIIGKEIIQNIVN